MIRKLLILLVAAFLLTPFLNKDLYTKSDIEQVEIRTRFGFYTKEMGDFFTKNLLMRAYLNRIFPFANKYFYKLAHP